MAKKITEIPARTRYPWEVWFAPGAKYMLKPGEDFSIPLKSMACQCYAVAKRKGVKIRAVIDSKKQELYLETLGAQGTKPAKKTKKSSKIKKKGPVNNG